MVAMVAMVAMIVTRFLKLLLFLKKCDPMTEWMSVNAEVKKWDP